MRRNRNWRRSLVRELVGEERGIALVMALGILVVCAIMLTTVIAYTSSAQRTASVSKSRLTAFDAADAGMNNAYAVLNLPSNNSLKQSILPPCHTANPDTTTPAATNPTWMTSSSNLTSQSTWNTNAYGTATTYWCGDLDVPGAQWFLRSIGSIRNPIGNGSKTTRMLTAKVTVQPTLTQPKNNPVWDYLYAGHTGSTCDQTLNNNISGSSRMYVAGNLCLSPNVNLAQSMVIVRGNLDLSNNASVGANTNMSTRVETYVGGNCRYGSNSPPWVVPCTGNRDVNHIYSKLSDGTTAAVNNVAPVIAPPAADFAGWYQDAIPGPSQPCGTSSGPVPTFDTNYPTRDNNVATAFDLTPSTSYTCRVGRGGSTTLSSAITASQTTISVASASGFPTSGTYRIRIDDEAMTVTGGQGTTSWTVTRAVNGTTAAAH